MSCSREVRRISFAWQTCLTGALMLLVCIGCTRAAATAAHFELPSFKHESSDPHCIGKIITGPTILQESIVFVEVQLESDPNTILPAITSRESGLDSSDLVAVWFIKIGKMKYFPIGGTVDLDRGGFHNPIVLAEKPHPEWTEPPAHSIYCPRRRQ